MVKLVLLVGSKDCKFVKFHQIRQPSPGLERFYNVTMKNIYMSLAWFFLYPALIGAGLSAQGLDIYGPEESFRDIRLLREGCLVVRLEGEQRKLDALQQLWEKADASGKAQLDSRMEEIKAQRDSFNLHLIRAFRSGFRFCPVYFIYDHDARDFLEGQRTGIFLNDEGIVDPVIGWEDKPFLGLRSGEALNGPEGLIMTDATFADLKDPFPWFVQRNSFGSFVNWILAREIYYRKNADRMVSKLDKRLLNFLEKAGPAQ